MTITLYANEIEHTIRQILHRAGCDLESLTLKGYVQMDKTESDAELLTRLIRTGVAKVKTILRNHITPVTENATDELDNGYDTYAFALDLDGDGQSLADLLHWFVVWWVLKTLGAMFGLTNIAGKANSEVEEAEELIKEELLALAMPIKERRSVTRASNFTPSIILVDGDDS